MTESSQERQVILRNLAPILKCDIAYEKLCSQVKEEIHKHQCMDGVLTRITICSESEQIVERLQSDFPCANINWQKIDSNDIYAQIDLLEIKNVDFEEAFQDCLKFLEEEGCICVGDCCDE